MTVIWKLAQNRSHEKNTYQPASTYGALKSALYEVESILLRQNQEIDRCETEFGIRWFYFSAKHGFFLNGSPYKIHGANVHQDHAGWSDAVPRSGIQRDIWMIKSAE